MTLSITARRKNYKKNHILNLIRYSSSNISRSDIKRKTEYSMTTVLNTVAELLDEKLIYEDAPDQSELLIGRKPTYLHLNPAGGYFIGIEFNIQKMHWAILDFSGIVIYSNYLKIKNDVTSDEILTCIYSCIDDAMQNLGVKSSKCLGIGIGMPGYIDSEKGIALHYAYIDDWVNLPITGQVESKYNIPCYILNNSDCMVLAYKWLAFKGNSDDFVFISIRTGARAIPVLNNQPYFGSNGTAGELGHIPVPGNKKQCFCGKTGCLNTIIGDFSVKNYLLSEIENGRFKNLFTLSENNINNISTSLLVQSALSNDPDSLSYLYYLASVLGNSLIPVVNLFAPKKIILSGRLAEAGDLFIDAVSRILKEAAVDANAEQLEVLKSIYNDNIGAIGAAMLVLQKEYDIATTVI